MNHIVIDSMQVAELRIEKSTSSYGRWCIRVSPEDLKYFWRKDDAVRWLEGLDERAI